MKNDPNINQYGTKHARSLEEVRDVCDRHLRNISRTQYDLIDNEDGTPTDDFYINMFRETWQMLRDDVDAILKKNVL